MVSANHKRNGKFCESVLRNLIKPIKFTNKIFISNIIIVSNCKITTWEYKLKIKTRKKKNLKGLFLK